MDSANAFPADFLWGAATAAYQIEGASESRGEVVWDRFLADGHGFRGDTGTIAADHVNRLEHDLDLIAGLGLRAYRFSISWARVMPDARTPAADGLGFYERLVDGLLERGITPLATLHHLDPPAALGAGVWAEREAAERFAEYAAYVGGQLGDRVGLWVTMNEPLFESLLCHYDGSWPPGERDLGRALASFHHKLLGHGLAASALKAERRDLQVGFVNNYSPCIPVTDSDEDHAAAARIDTFTNRYLLDALLRGAYPAAAVERYERLGVFGAVRDGDLATVAGTTDFLGVNYYNRRHLADSEALSKHGNGTGSVDLGYNMRILSDLGVTELPPPSGVETSALGWAVEPEGLRQSLTAITERYGRIPLYVTENGIALSDYVDPESTINDEPRIDYLQRHIGAIGDAIGDGADVRGYFTWSLMDNLEWNLGYAPRFGLVYVDFATQTRYPKRSYGWYRDFIAAQLAGSSS